MVAPGAQPHCGESPAFARHGCREFFTFARHGYEKGIETLAGLLGTPLSMLGLQSMPAPVLLLGPQPFAREWEHTCL